MVKPRSFMSRFHAGITSALFLLIAGIAIPVIAHHSTAAFDRETVVRIEGSVTQFRWTNPHATFKVEGNADGAPDGLWTVEMTAPNVLINQGWKRNSLRLGDDVVVFVNPLKNRVELNDGSEGGLYVGVVLADGSTLGQTDGDGEGTDN